MGAGARTTWGVFLGKVGTCPGSGTLQKVGTVSASWGRGHHKKRLGRVAPKTSRLPPDEGKGEGRNVKKWGRCAFRAGLGAGARRGWTGRCFGRPVPTFSDATYSSAPCCGTRPNLFIFGGCTTKEGWDGSPKTGRPCPRKVVRFHRRHEEKVGTGRPRKGWHGSPKEGWDGSCKKSSPQKFENVGNPWKIQLFSISGGWILARPVPTFLSGGGAPQKKVGTGRPKTVDPSPRNSQI